MIGRRHRRPRVGVTSSRGKAVVMWAFYWLALTLAGVRPIRLLAPPAGEVSRLPELDGLVIGGGDDIGAGLYDGEPSLDIRIDPARDALELALLEKAEARALPVLGVCRGAQMMNVFHGGTLHQDLSQAGERAVPPMWSPLPRKRVGIDPQSRLAAITGRTGMVVNSLHHQAIKAPGRGLTVSARDGFRVVQAIEARAGPFRVGVQWHPEFLIFQKAQRRLFGAFVAALRDTPEGG